MKTGCIIQARTSSTRLPKKVLKELPWGSGVTILEQVIKRAAEFIPKDNIIIATTNEKCDDAIVEIAKSTGTNHFRGSLEDVLSRYYHAAKKYHLDHIIRITSDCPCIDAKLIEKTFISHISKDFDYTSTGLGRRTYPIGMDVEIIKFKALEEAFRRSEKKYDREHVTPYIYMTASENYRLNEYPSPTDRYSDIRVTVDTQEDYTLACAVYDLLGESFTLEEIISLFEKKPWLKTINGHISQKTKYNSTAEELKAGVKLLTLNDMTYAANQLNNFIINQ